MVFIGNVRRKDGKLQLVKEVDDCAYPIIRFEKVTEDDYKDGDGVIYNMCPDCFKNDSDSENSD